MPQATTQRFRIRKVLTSDFKELLDFYLANRSPALPLESAKTVGDAIEAGRILIVQPQADRRIVASGSLFQLTPQASPTYVAELAGMRVTNALGGAKPVTAQMMLIGLRVLGHVALEPMPFEADATNSIIAAVHKENASSIGNLEAMQMHPLRAPLPDWVTYNQIGWYGSAINDDWLYYFADNDTIIRSLEVLAGVGLFNGKIALHRQNKMNGQQEVFEFVPELNDLVIAAEDLQNILRRVTRVALVPPPPTIVFRK